MTLLLLQADVVAPYGQWGIAGAVLVIVGMILGFLLRALPTWREVKGQDKEVKLAEIAVREKEAESRSAQATSFGQLSNALKSMSDVLNNVAVEQRHATESVRIQQRVSADIAGRTEEAVNQLAETVSGISARIDSIEELVAKD